MLLGKAVDEYTHPTKLERQNPTKMVPWELPIFIELIVEKDNSKSRIESDPA